MLSVAMLSVAMLSVDMLSVAMLSVTMLSVVMPSVVAPRWYREKIWKKGKFVIERDLSKVSVSPFKPISSPNGQKLLEEENMMSNGREPKNCLGQVLNFKLDSFSFTLT